MWDFFEDGKGKVMIWQKVIILFAVNPFDLLRMPHPNFDKQLRAV